MTQATFTQIRAALATRIATIAGLRVYPERTDQVDPPACVILPVQGSLIRYGTTMDGSAEISLRAVLLMAKGDSTAGQAAMDPYLATTGPLSVYAALQADPSLGGTVQWAVLMEATGYGLMAVGAMDYLACHLIISAGI